MSVSLENASQRRADASRPPSPHLAAKLVPRRTSPSTSVGPHKVSAANAQRLLAADSGLTVVGDDASSSLVFSAAMADSWKQPIRDDASDKLSVQSSRADRSDLSHDLQSAYYADHYANSADNYGNTADVALAGWIWRRGSLMQWRRLYAVARSRQLEAGILSLFQAENDPYPIRSIQLSECVGVHMREKKNSARFEFKLERRKGDLILASDSPQDAYQWCKVLNTLIPKIIQPEMDRIEHELSLANVHADQLEREKQDLLEEKQQLTFALANATSTVKPGDQHLKSLLTDAHRKEQSLSDVNERLREQNDELLNENRKLKLRMNDMLEKHKQMRLQLHTLEQRETNIEQSKIVSAIDDVRHVVVQHIENIDNSVVQLTNTSTQLSTLETTVSNLVVNLQGTNNLNKEKQQLFNDNHQTIITGIHHLKSTVSDVHESYKNLLKNIEQSSTQLTNHIQLTFKELNSQFTPLKQHFSTLVTTLASEELVKSLDQNQTIKLEQYTINLSTGLQEMRNQVESIHTHLRTISTLEKDDSEGMRHQVLQHLNDMTIRLTNHEQSLKDLHTTFLEKWQTETNQRSTNDTEVLYRTIHDGYTAQAQTHHVNNLMTLESLNVIKEQILPTIHRDVILTLQQEAENQNNLTARVNSLISQFDNYSTSNVNQFSQLETKMTGIDTLSDSIQSMNQNVNNCITLLSELNAKGANNNATNEPASPSKTLTPTLYKIQDALTFLLVNMDKKLQNTHDVNHQLLMSIQNRLGTLVSSCETLKRNEGVLTLKVNDTLAVGDDVKRILTNICRGKAHTTGSSPIDQLLLESDVITTLKSTPSVIDQVQETELLTEVRNFKKTLFDFIQEQRSKSTITSETNTTTTVIAVQHDTERLRDQFVIGQSDIDDMYLERDALIAEVSMLLDRQRDLQLIVSHLEIRQATYTHNNDTQTTTSQTQVNVEQAQKTVEHLEDTREQLIAEIENLRLMRTGFTADVNRLESTKSNVVEEEMLSLNKELSYISKEVEHLEERLQNFSHIAQYAQSADESLLEKDA